MVHKYQLVAVKWVDNSDAISQKAVVFFLILMFLPVYLQELKNKLNFNVAWRKGAPLPKPTGRGGFR